MHMFGDTHAFERFHCELETDRSLEPGPRKRQHFSSDNDAIIRVKQVTGLAEISQIASFDKETRDTLLAMLRDDGFTIPLLARITGVSRSVIQRAR